jgi:hypothetical protein
LTGLTPAAVVAGAADVAVVAPEGIGALGEAVEDSPAKSPADVHDNITAVVAIVLPNFIVD